MEVSNASFVRQYGPWALVTGASSGIGEQFARSLAARGLNVILVARRLERLKALSAELREKHSVQAHILPVDLSKPGAAEEVRAGAAGFEIGMLVNNAGVDLIGLFLNETQEDLQRLIAVNVATVAALANALGKPMAERRRGAIIFVSSLSAHPSPYGALYASSKAFVSTLAVSLKYEMADFGIDILAFEPGFVRSEMYDRAKQAMDPSTFGFEVMDTDEAVESCLQALRKEVVHTPGWKNVVGKFLIRHLPTWLCLPALAKAMRGALPPAKVVLSS